MPVALSVELFALQRACVGERNRRTRCHSLASSPAEAIESHRKNRLKIDPGGGLGALKIDRNSVPGCSRDASRRPRVSRRGLGSVSGASWGVPGAPRERPEDPQGCPGTPERALGSLRKRAEAAQIDAKSRPGTKTSSFLRTVRSQTDFRPIFARFSFDFRMITQVVRGALS